MSELYYAPLGYLDFIRQCHEQVDPDGIIRLHFHDQLVWVTNLGHKS